MFVLDGGLTRWEQEGYEICTTPPDPSSIETARFSAGFNRSLLLDLNEVKKISETKSLQLLDARPKGRFDGVDPEPRAELPSGHVPGAINLPFTDVVEDGSLKSPDAMMELAKSISLDTSKPFGVMCGSGVSAATVALAFYEAGIDRIPIYDGSWTEWAETQLRPVTNEK